MSWGKEWPSQQMTPEIFPPGNVKQPWVEKIWPNPITVGIDLGSEPSQTATAIIKDGQIVEWSIKCQDDPKGDIDFGLMKDVLLYGKGFSQDGRHVPLEKVYNNLSPTHDPYTNPNSQIYYQCKCGMILDPGTKSFAALNNCASEKGWKIRWSKDGQGYEPFCVECGEGVE